jgi:hypothetical protein
MTGLADDFGKYVIFVITIILQVYYPNQFNVLLINKAMTATSLFVLCGALAPNPQLALILAPISIVLFMLFGGFFISLSTIPVWYSWFGYISFFRY